MYNIGIAINRNGREVMSNKEEFNKILQIIGTDEYPEDKEFSDGCNAARQVISIRYMQSFRLLMCVPWMK